MGEREGREEGRGRDTSSNTPLTLENDWNQGTRRILFDAFAKRKKFDPLDPSNWYPVKMRDLSLFHQVRKTIRRIKLIQK